MNSDAERFLSVFDAALDHALKPVKEQMEKAETPEERREIIEEFENDMGMWRNRQAR